MSLLCYDARMRRTTTALLLGTLLGIVLTWGAVSITGGLYSYTLLSPAECRSPGGTDLGSSDIAPGQPNPCLLRTPRFGLR